jgi:phenylalanyl-tRNA synthetase alpha chain
MFVRCALFNGARMSSDNSQTMSLADFESAVNAALSQALNQIDSAESLDALEACRVATMGKKGALTECLKQVSALDKADRPAVGQLANTAKQQLNAKLESKKIQLASEAEAAMIAATALDVSMPARDGSKVGTFHPVSIVRQRVEAIFKQAGFSVAEGPEIEDDYHNFTALNIPATHPARAMQDTFYFGDGAVLRTHTSPVQVRVMADKQPPLRIIAPGKVFRRDSDHTHTPMFHQLEGLVIDANCTFANLKGLIQDFVAAFFGEALPIRFRPSYFPFTEPSAEVDIQCSACKGEGCRTCSYNGWLEVLGCGMVHPNVLREAGIDPDAFKGYAFGVGLDRLAMLLFQMPDLRALFENRQELLEQFRGLS